MGAARARRLARLSTIAVVSALALLTTAFDQPGMRAQPIPEPVRAVPFAGSEFGHAAAASPLPPLICLDPGHSLAKPGMVVTVSTVADDGRVREQELREVDINLDVARAVARILRARFGEAAVVMTWGEADGRARAWDALSGPTGDEKPYVIARGAFCALRRARSVASIHTNWFGDAPNGTLTGYRDAGDRAFAEAVHPLILDAMRSDQFGVPHAGFVDYGLDRGDWFLTLGFGDRDVPAVILEPAMMSDPAEARRLVPTISAAPAGRRAQIAAVEAHALGDWIASALLGER